MGTSRFYNVAIGTNPDPGTGTKTTAKESVGVGFVMSVDVSTAERSRTVNLPDNAFLHTIIGMQQGSTGLTQGLKITIGETGSAASFGTINNFSSGSLGATMAVKCVSAKQVIVEATASVAASAADFTNGVRVWLMGGTYV